MKSNFLVRIVNSLFVFFPMSRLHGLKCTLLRFAGLRIGKNVRIWSTAKFYGSSIEIGDDSFIGFNVQLFPSANGPIKIGANCSLGVDVIVHTGGHYPGNGSNRTGKGYSRPITIGDGCRISTRSVILEGATIGHGSQIAAGSIIIADVFPNTLVGGVPAKFLKNLEL